MTGSDSSNPTRLSGTAAALERRLVELGLDDGPVEQTQKELAVALACSEDAVFRGLARLRSLGLLAAERTSIPGGRNRYARPAELPPRNSAEPPNRPTADPPDPRAPDDYSVEAEEVEVAAGGNQGPPPHRAHARESSADAEPRAAEAEEPREPVEPPVPLGQLTVGWAVAAQRRLGLPPLAGALLTKVGSQAKRLADEGLDLDELKAAVETLVEGGHSDLLLAHRKAQTRVDLAELHAAAEASSASRDHRRVFGPLETEALVEVWSLLALTWRNAKLPDEAERALWAREFAHWPVGAILFGVRRYAEQGEAWPPTWGQVKAAALPRLREEQDRARVRARAERERELDAAYDAEAAARRNGGA